MWPHMDNNYRKWIPNVLKFKPKHSKWISKSEVQCSSLTLFEIGVQTENLETVPIKENHEIEATHDQTDNSYE